jgi:hypothetical protein
MHPLIICFSGLKILLYAAAAHKYKNYAAKQGFFSAQVYYFSVVEQNAFFRLRDNFARLFAQHRESPDAAASLQFY